MLPQELLPQMRALAETVFLLFRRDKSQWADDGGGQVHERLDVAGPCTTLTGDLLHYSFQNIQQYLVKHVQYSSVFLQTQKGKGMRWSVESTG